jgi:hypothetical protein
MWVLSFVGVLVSLGQQRLCGWVVVVYASRNIVKVRIRECALRFFVAKEYVRRSSYECDTRQVERRNLVAEGWSSSFRFRD